MDGHSDCEGEVDVLGLERNDGDSDLVAPSDFEVKGERLPEFEEEAHVDTEGDWELLLGRAVEVGEGEAEKDTVIVEVADSVEVGDSVLLGLGEGVFEDEVDIVLVAEAQRLELMVELAQAEREGLCEFEVGRAVPVVEEDVDSVVDEEGLPDIVDVDDELFV